jgi:hypothetical protein
MKLVNQDDVWDAANKGRLLDRWNKEIGASSKVCLQSGNWKGSCPGPLHSFTGKEEMTIPSRKFLSLALSVRLFAALLFWMYNALAGSFGAIADNHYKKAAEAAMGSVPSKDEAIGGWIRRISGPSREFDLLFLKGFPEDEGGMKVFAPTPGLGDFFAHHGKDPDFARGIESAMYDEISTNSGSFSAGWSGGSSSPRPTTASPAKSRERPCFSSLPGGSTGFFSFCGDSFSSPWSSSPRSSPWQATAGTPSPAMSSSACSLSWASSWPIPSSRRSG